MFSDKLNKNHVRPLMPHQVKTACKTCKLSNAEREIKSQIILTCSSSRLRRRALTDSSLTLKELLDLARAFETSEMQAAGIENNTSQ